MMSGHRPRLAGGVLSRSRHLPNDRGQFVLHGGDMPDQTGSSGVPEGAKRVASVEVTPYDVICRLCDGIHTFTSADLNTVSAEVIVFVTQHRHDEG
jgi:hypothetical protein